MNPLEAMISPMNTEVILAMMGAVPADLAHTPAYDALANEVGERLAFPGYTDEAIKERIEKHEKVGARGIVREGKTLLEYLTLPSQRFDAVCRAHTIQNLTGTVWSGAVHMACQDIINGRPKPKTYAF